MALKCKSVTHSDMNTKILLSPWHPRSPRYCFLILSQINNYSISAHKITWAPQNGAERLFQVTLLCNIFWQDKANALKQISQHNSWPLFLFKRSFCRKMSSNPSHQMSLASQHLFLRPEIKTGKRFYKEKSVRDCYQKISLGDQFCSWQSSTFCTQDVLSMEQESTTAQMRLPFKGKVDPTHSSHHL